MKNAMVEKKSNMNTVHNVNNSRVIQNNTKTIRKQCRVGYVLRVKSTKKCPGSHCRENKVGNDTYVHLGVFNIPKRQN